MINRAPFTVCSKERHNVLHSPTVTDPDAVVAVAMLPASSSAVNTNRTRPSAVGLSNGDALPTVNEETIRTDVTGMTLLTISSLVAVLKTTLLAKLIPSLVSNRRVTELLVVAREVLALFDAIVTICRYPA